MFQALLFDYIAVNGGLAIDRAFDQQFQIQQFSHKKLVFTEDRSPVGTVFD
jgi:hypothetical protein